MSSAWPDTWHELPFSSKNCAEWLKPTVGPPPVLVRSGYCRSSSVGLLTFMPILQLSSESAHEGDTISYVKSRYTRPSDEILITRIVMIAATNTKIGSPTFKKLFFQPFAILLLYIV